MTGSHPHDPDLRQLLDSIGLNAPEASADELRDPEASVRAHAMLSRVLEQPRGGRRDLRAPLPRAPRQWTPIKLVAASAICALVAVAMVVWLPGSGPQPAAAQTPPMLTFSRATAEEIRTAGSPAQAVLGELAARAAALPPEPALPVQRISAEAWWTSTDPADKTNGPRTVLVPRRLEVFQLADGTRRSIERRGTPLDSHGSVVDVPGSWDSVPVETDETFPNDLGADYPQSLPTSIEGLRRQLAPTSACGSTSGGCLLGAVNDLYAGYVVDPAITARLWRLLASDASITWLGTTTDRLGRTADAFVADALDPTQRILVLIDPETGSYLGSETVLVRPNPGLSFAPPAVTAFTAIVEARRISGADVPDDAATTRY